jgi:adenylate kinase
MIDLTYFDPGFDKVILLKISTETSIYRLSGRRTCRSCRRVFNINTAPPKVKDICDVCGGELYQREDDTEEAIRRRLEIYYSDTQEVVEFFRNKGILLEIDAEPAPDAVFESVLAALNLKK